MFIKDESKTCSDKDEDEDSTEVEKIINYADDIGAGVCRIARVHITSYHSDIEVSAQYCGVS